MKYPRQLTYDEESLINPWFLKFKSKIGQPHRFGLLAKMVNYVREYKSGYRGRERGRSIERERGEVRRGEERKRERERERA
jgi:hypothetical protein